VRGLRRTRGTRRGARLQKRAGRQRSHSASREQRRFRRSRATQHVKWNDTTLTVNGGTYDLEAPEKSPPEAKEILDDLGIEPARLIGFRDPDNRERFGLASTCFFDPDVFPGVRTKQFVSGFHDIAWDQFFAKTPLSESERAELMTLYTTRKNYLADEADPEQAMASMTWESYIPTRWVSGMRPF